MSATTRRRGTGSTGEIPELRVPTMAHVGFQGARHMHPERLPSAKKERTMSVRLFDTTEDTLNSMEGQSGNVKILMVSGLKLNTLNEEICSRMKHLQKIDLSENQLGDSSLPDSFKTLDNLVELNLNNNKFTKIPTTIKKLKNLTRLSLSFNSIDSLKGIEKLKKMQVLMLDNNKFTSVFKDVCHMRKLEIFDCSSNNIREVGLDVRYLKNIRELNVTNNKISVLPTDVFQLTTLESLKASHNQISKIPVFNMNPQHCHLMSEIDLSSNVINKFPGHLMVITKKLDLSANRIKTLELNKMKKLEMDSQKELCVDGNPLTFPPSDVCECGLKSMIQFIQETQINQKVYQGVKILVLGAPKSGKTSFVQTLVDGQPRLSEEMYEKSAGIEVSDMTYEDIKVKEEPPPPINVKVTHHSRRLSNHKHLNGHVNGLVNGDQTESSENGTEASTKRSLNLCIWDFCGDSFYMYPHYMFFEQPAIAILTFNMYTYKSEQFDEVISSWFDWMIAKTNKLCVLLVGTHSDKLKKGQIKTVCNEVKAKLQAHAEKQRQIVQKKIDEITEKTHITQTMSAQLNAYSLLLQEKFVVQSEVIITSASKNTGYETIAASIEMLSNDSRQFPNVLRPIPTFWLDVETYVEDKGNTMFVPVVKYEELKEEIGTKFGMKHLVNPIMQYLHETGKVLWFANNAALKDVVILRPAWFFDIFRAIFRHDLKDKLAIEVEDSFKTIGITQTKYDQLKEEFLEEGIIDRDLLKCMLSHLLPLETNGPFFEVLNLLLDNLDLGYLVQKRGTSYNLDADKESMHSRKYLIPWFRKVPEPDSIQELWEPLAGKQRLAGVCRFPKYMPPGLFEMLSVRAHAAKHRLRYLSHWSNGFHAKHKDVKLQIVFSHTKHETDSGTTLKFELRDDNTDPNADPASAAAMWNILLPILMDLEELLHSYTGVLVERLMECPNCKVLSFIGEWLTPKETQGMNTRPCVECMDEIDTAFLVQPREKKRDYVRLNLARMRQKRRDALKGSADCKGMSVHAPARQGRRTAVMPGDMTMMSRPSVSAATGSEVDGSDYGDTPSSSRMSGGMGLLPGLNPEEMTSFLSNLHANADQDQNSADDELTSPSESVRRTSSVGGPATFFMTKDGSNVSGTGSDVTEDAQPQMNGNTLPGLSSDQMALFMKRHANLINEDENDQDNEDGEND